MRKVLLLLLGILVLCAQSFAQDRSIAGKIVDDSNQPVAGASVTLKGTRVGTFTDANGNFALTVPSSARTLVVSAVGHGTQEVSVGNLTTFNITLKQEASVIEEVVVTGYSREKKSNFAGAATVLSSKVVETTPVGAFDQALQGRAPGLQVNSGSGQPGSSAQMWIRGPQSIQAAFASPLFVIDGVPMPAFDMQTINPNDFESITILKDASAAALYGARGGVGVIVITTKKGKSGTNFTFRTQAGFTQKPDFSRLNMMNTAEILQYEEMLGLAGAGTTGPGWQYSSKNPAYANLPATSPANNPFAASQARYNAILDSIRGIDMDYTDLFFRQGVTQTHELNMSAGTDKTKIFISGQFMDQEGIDLGSSLRRYTGRFNIDHTANKISVTWNTQAGYSRSDLSEGEWLGNSPRSPFQMTYRAKPYENPYKPDGSLNFGSNTILNLKQIANLLEGIQNSQWRQDQIKVNSGLTLAYRVLPNLTLRNTTGIDVSNDVFNRNVNAASYIGSLQTYQSGTYIDAHRMTTQLINTTGAVFNHQFAERHDVEAGAYFEVVRGRQKGFSFQLFNLDPRLTNTGQGASPLPTNGAATMTQNATAAKTGFGIRSYFGTLRYSYDNRYSFTGNVRRDGTSRIVNEENREITTWSAGLIWNAIRESFLANQNVLSDLRLRLSYGVVPNIGSIPTSSYNMIQTITAVTNYQGPQVPTFATTSYAGSTLTGLRPATPGNPDLKIERIQKANVGVDFAVWSNRARFTVEVYRNKTIDLFVRNPLPANSGFNNLDINAGIMTNKGVEFQTSVDVLRGRDFGLTLGLNHAINKNNIEDLGSVDEYFLGTFLIKEGLPYGSHYTYHYLGADPQTGRPRFETADGGETTDPGQAAQFAKFGTFIPKHVGGFTADFNYKGFTVGALFSYQFDVVRSNNTRNWITRGIAGYHASVNASREMLTDQWMKPGDNKFFQNPLYDRGFTSSDLEDAKFLRFRNLIVSYQIPKISIGQTQIVKGARFYVQGQNLAVWSPWQGLDPEDNNNISLTEYPNPKMFVVGLDINF